MFLNLEGYFDADIQLTWDPRITTGYGYGLVNLRVVEGMLTLLVHFFFRYSVGFSSAQLNDIGIMLILLVDKHFGRGSIVMSYF